MVGIDPLVRGRIGEVGQHHTRPGCGGGDKSHRSGNDHAQTQLPRRYVGTTTRRRDRDPTLRREVEWRLVPGHGTSAASVADRKVLLRPRRPARGGAHPDVPVVRGVRIGRCGDADPRGRRGNRSRPRPPSHGRSRRRAHRIRRPPRDARAPRPASAPPQLSDGGRDLGRVVHVALRGRPQAPGCRGAVRQRLREVPATAGVGPPAGRDDRARRRDSAQRAAVRRRQPRRARSGRLRHGDPRHTDHRHRPAGVRDGGGRRKPGCAPVSVGAVDAAPVRARASAAVAVARLPRRARAVRAVRNVPGGPPWDSGTRHDSYLRGARLLESALRECEVVRFLDELPS